MINAADLELLRDVERDVDKTYTATQLIVGLSEVKADSSKRVEKARNFR